jgi:hypothetical protein
MCFVFLRWQKRIQRQEIIHLQRNLLNIGSQNKSVPRDAMPSLKNKNKIDLKQKSGVYHQKGTAEEGHQEEGQVQEAINYRKTSWRAGGVAQVVERLAE